MRFYNLLILFFILFMVSSYFGEPLYAYNEKTTHIKINEAATQQSSLDSILKLRFGFADGIEHKFENKPAKQWIEKGGDWEDTIFSLGEEKGPDHRYLRHFHDPLLTWDKAGLWGFDSAILWAMKNTENPLAFNNLYSWPIARKYFYNALTGDNPEHNYAELFRALGQILHLVSDAAVPAHTRNDLHPGHLLNYIFLSPRLVADPYELWAADNYKDTALINYAGRAVDPAIFSRADLSQSPSNPISALWDQNLYTGANPLVTGSSDLGLAEFSNANFLSINSMFHSYPYPRLNETDYNENIWLNPEQVDAEDGVVDQRIYFRKNTGEPIEHFAAAGYWYRQLYIWSKPELKYAFVLDEKCHLDYAAHLIPRAVGYSTALLNYFFRGTLEISAPDTFVYGIIDGGKEPHEFAHIKAKVKNTTPDEGMNGTLVAVAKYKLRKDYKEDLSTDPPLSISREEAFSYSVSAPIEGQSLSPGQSQNYTFDFSDHKIPAGITDLFLQVIFKGTLGNEENIAVAVGMKDLTEPTHITVWNSTDYVYVNDPLLTGKPYGILVTARQIRDDTRLFQAADKDSDGILNEVRQGEIYIDPHVMTRELGFYPSGGSFATYQAVFADMPPGRYGKVIVLMDTPSFTLQIRAVSSMPSMDKKTPYQLSATINQIDSNGKFQSTGLQEFRKKQQHLWSAFAWYLGSGNGISVAGWPPLANENLYPVTRINP